MTTKAKPVYFHDGSTTISPYAKGQLKPVKIPRELGAAIDLLYDINRCRRDFEAIAGRYEAAEKELKEILIKAVETQKLDGASGKIAKINVSPASKPIFENFDEFFKFLLKTKNPALIQRRLSDAAVEELWAAGKKVPGVTKWNYKKVSLTKA